MPSYKGKGLEDRFSQCSDKAPRHENYKIDPHKTSSLTFPTLSFPFSVTTPFPYALLTPYSIVPNWVQPCH